jgi:hypothetical protein
MFEYFSVCATLLRVKRGEIFVSQVYVAVETHFAIAKLSFRMPIVQGMRVKPLFDLDASVVKNVTVMRFVCLTVSPTKQWHFTLMGEESGPLHQKFHLFQIPALQNRQCTIKRDENYTHGYPFQQLNSAKTSYVEVRIPERQDGETPAMSACSVEMVTEEKARYDIFEQVKKFMFERIGGVSTVKQTVKVGEGREWVLASWNFALGNIFRLVGTVMRTNAGILIDEGGTVAKTKAKGKRAAPDPVNLAENAAEERVQRKRQPPAKLRKTPAKPAAKGARGGQKVSPAVGSAATSGATHTQEDGVFGDMSWEDVEGELEALPVTGPLDELSEDEERAPPSKKRRTRKERCNIAVSCRTGSCIIGRFAALFQLQDRCLCEVVWCATPGQRASGRFGAPEEPVDGAKPPGCAGSSSTTDSGGEARPSRN